MKYLKNQRNDVILSKIFVISDTHFGDGNIIKYENRPFETIEEMDNKLIENWNNAVSDKDTIFHLGDFSAYTDKIKIKEIFDKLNGRKILVMGNHDNILSVKEWLKIGFDEVYSYPLIYNEFIVMQHQPPQYINDKTPFFYIYGHVHATEIYPTISKQSACVCVERWDYSPIDFEEIKNRVFNL